MNNNDIMIYQSPARTSGEASYTAVGPKTRLGFPLIALAGLITSYFYVLPLGRYAVAGIYTDYRLFDFAFLFFIIIVGLNYLPQLRALGQDRSSFFTVTVVFLWLLWMSLTLTFFLGGSSSLLPALIRAFRFSAYLLTAGFVVVIVNSAYRYRFLLGVIYLNIVVQALLAFAQGIGQLDSFWPDYWLRQYGVWPVGTLSPHHLHVGIVMLLGVALTLVFVRQPIGMPLRVLLIGLLGIMCAVIVMAGIRTAMVGLVGLAVADFLGHKGRSLGYWVVVTLALVIMFRLSGTAVQSAVQSTFDRVVADRYNQLGLEGIMLDRVKVYSNFPDAIRAYPWILLIGTGFQNSTAYIGAAGAHNNYLHVLFELGLVGLAIYMRFLFRVLSNLRSVAHKMEKTFEGAMALGMWGAFIAIMITMLMGETLWAQYSQFTLTGQIMALMALAISPLHW